MIRKAILIALSLALSLVLLGCTTGVSQEEYDSVMDEVNAAQDEIAGLEAERDAHQDEIAGLEAERDAAQAEAARLAAEIEDLDPSLATQAVEEAWDRAQQRHNMIMQEIPFLDELEEIAPWIRFPDKPTWFDSARVCSTVLADDPVAYEGVCIVITDTQQMLVRLSDFDSVTSMICQGSSVDYEITMVRNESGKIIQEMMRTGESSIVLDWVDTGIDEIIIANVNGEIFEAPWSEEPDYALSLFSDLADWLETIDMTGGFIKPQDQPLVIIALGELRKSSYDIISLDIIEILQRAVSDFMEGVPQTCM